MKNKYDWSSVPARVNVITTDSFGDMDYWVMHQGCLPVRGEHGWFDEYRGRLFKSQKSKFKGDWRESLETRPGEDFTVDISENLKRAKTELMSALRALENSNAKKSDIKKLEGIISRLESFQNTCGQRG